MADHVHDDEVNNQGDYTSGAIGSDGKDIVVGKNISTYRTEENRRTEDNRRNEQRQRAESNNNFNFQTSDNPLFQLFLAIQDVRNGVSEFRSETRQSTGTISDKLDANNRRLSSLESEFANQRREIDGLKERGLKRDEKLELIQAKINEPPPVIVAATNLTRFQFWLFVVVIISVAIIAIVIGLFLMRSMH